VAAAARLWRLWRLQMLRLLTFTCLAASITALTQMPWLKVSRSRALRSRKVSVQLWPDWLGQSPWQQPQAATAEAMWVIAPADGVLNEYVLRNGDEQVLGRYEMVEHNPYVSRAQCLVRVAADGTASVISLGKAQTHVVKVPIVLIDLGQGEQWISRTVVLAKGESHVLVDREQIALGKEPKNGALQGIFSVYAAPQDANGQLAGDTWPSGAYSDDQSHGDTGTQQNDGFQQGGYPQQGGGYPQHGGGYPQQGGGYPQQGGGYLWQGSSYPQQGGGYPRHPR